MRFSLNSDLYNTCTTYREKLNSTRMQGFWFTCAVLCSRGWLCVSGCIWGHQKCQASGHTKERGQEQNTYRRPLYFLSFESRLLLLSCQPHTSVSPTPLVIARPHFKCRSNGDRGGPRGGSTRNRLGTTRFNVPGHSNPARHFPVLVRRCPHY